MKVETRRYVKDDVVTIPVSFGTFVKGVSKRYTTGFVEAKFIEYTGVDQALIRYGDDIFTISTGQIV